METAKFPDDVEFLKNEIRLLRQEVKTAQMPAHAYNTMIDVVEEMYHIPKKITPNGDTVSYGDSSIPYG